MKAKFGKTWWGEQWLQALAHIDFDNRIPRGAAYARKGAVKSLSIDKNVITARVQGSRATPYKIKIVVPLFSEAEKDRLMAEVANFPAVLSSLTNHELDPSILTLARLAEVQIFPLSWKYFEMDCSCPDWAVPCKHIAAVIYVLSQEIDANPFLIFELHGMDFAEELRSRGIVMAAGSKDEVPLLGDLLATAGEAAEGYRAEEAARQVDITGLPDLSGPLAQLLPDNPPFYTAGDFKPMYQKGVRAWMRWAEKAQKSLGWLADRVGAEALGRLPDIRKPWSIVLEADGSAHWLADGVEQDGLAALYALLDADAELLPRCSASALALRRLCIAALRMAARGAVVPQIFRDAGGMSRIRWRPALLDEHTARVAERCRGMLPPGTLLYRPAEAAPKRGRKKAVPEAVPLADQELEALTAVLTLLCHAALGKERYDGELLPMFFQQQGQKFARLGERETPGGILQWLKRYQSAKGKFTPVVHVAEAKDDTFEVTLGIRGAQQEGEVYVELKEIFASKKYEADRMEILQSIGLLSAYIDGVSHYVNSQGAHPIRYTMANLPTLLLDMAPCMTLMGVELVVPRALQKLSRPRVTGRMSKSGKGHLGLDSVLHFDWQVAVGDCVLTAEEYGRLMLSAGRLLKFRGQYVFMTEGELKQLQRQLDCQEIGQAELMAMALTEEYEGCAIALDAGLRKEIDRLRQQKACAVPAGLKATLRPYQKTGYEWMYKNSKLGFGSIIADDMGLGKTVQVIALLLRLRDDKAVGSEAPALVVVPTAVLYNWMEELSRFAPKLKASLYHGAGRQWPEGCEVIVSSYGMVRSDIAALKKKKLGAIVIDEAQNIKNAGTEQSKAVKAMKAPVRIAMSGTPVENRLGEYWSIMDFCNKGLLGSQKAFGEQYAKPIEWQNDEQVAERFRRLTQPFMLRRLKTDKSIISDLPDKVEQNDYCTLTPEQSALYEEVLKSGMATIENHEGSDSKALFERQGLILQMMLSLKQVCNHPRQFLKQGDGRAELSGKMQMLYSLLDNIIGCGEKVLLFSQFKEMGAMLKGYVEEHYAEEALFYHGGCSVKERKAIVESFQNDASKHVLILSLKAAGVGLNLTAASHVIHYDLWWNPAVESQATDRAYRIGQNKNVQVHRFITQGTFEEKIDAMIQSKRHLAELTVTTGESWIGQLSNTEIRELFALQ